MEPVAPSGAQPLLEDMDILTVVDDDPEIRNIHDVPFVLVNQVGDEIHAEIVMSGVWEIDHDRLMTAQSVAAERGYRAYARVFADLYEDDNVVTLLFSEDPAKGVIWSLEAEAGNAWSR